MANLEKSKVIHWREGMRITGKHEMSVNEYGEYLMHSGKNKQNGRKRKHLTKAFS